MIAKKAVKRRILANTFYLLMGLVGGSEDNTIIRFTRWAELFAKKDYYKRIIRHIRSLFVQKHPSLDVARAILKDTHPKQKMKIIENFIINQLLVGTNLRKAFEDREGFYPPGFAVISPSMKCNLDCYGCYAGLYDKSNELTLNEINDVLDQLREMGIFYVVVSGGEPFYSQAMREAFKQNTDIAFMVYTNGSLIDDEMADALATWGNVVPCISVEGFEAETDARRGKGHFARVLQAMHLLRERKLIFGFSATLTKANAELITSDDFIDFYIEKGATIGWYFNYMPTGIGPSADIMPTAAQRDLLRQRVAYFRATKPILLGDFQNDGPIVGGCIAAGRKYFHINNKGDIEPCVFIHYAQDNIRDTRIKKALRSPLFLFLRKCQDSNPNLLRPCAIIDHPEFSRQAILESHAYPTHTGAELTYTDMKDAINRFAEDYAALADPIWRKMAEQKCSRPAATCRP